MNDLLYVLGWGKCTDAGNTSRTGQDRIEESGFSFVFGGNLIRLKLKKQVNNPNTRTTEKTHQRVHGDFFLLYEIIVCRTKN